MDKQDQRVDAATLYQSHGAFVASFAHRLGVPEADVEDVVQEVFVIAHRKGGYEPGLATPRTWLGAITVRVVSGLRRARRRRREEAAPDDWESIQDAGLDPQREAELRRSLARVQAALRTLTLAHRAVFVMFEIEGERCEDIARALGIPIGTVYSRLHKARARFRAAYAARAETSVAPERSPPAGCPVEEA